MRGCQKKVVYFKNTGSKIFDEAYFVISDKPENKRVISDDMIAEANRIIEECSFERKIKGEKKGFKRLKFLLKLSAAFVLGTITSAVVSFLIFYF